MGFCPVDVHECDEKCRNLNLGFANDIRYKVCKAGMFWVAGEGATARRSRCSAHGIVDCVYHCVDNIFWITKRWYVNDYDTKTNNITYQSESEKAQRRGAQVELGSEMSSRQDLLDVLVNRYPLLYEDVSGRWRRDEGEEGAEEAEAAGGGC